ncbi:hypothetical protein FOMPIDRAFT_1021389 [Fomitopsis schrenkii]|uniref:Uncharacterized protein n=1 Tax=Fomitopsis schrenkii TaxID=2126942 RepID=S8EKE2_FOMSC|nr:hypothetical protein FOMPIDRAFT_1021389 [Fomitopsis schrenkii]
MPNTLFLGTQDRTTRWRQTPFQSTLKCYARYQSRIPPQYAHTRSLATARGVPALGRTRRVGADRIRGVHNLRSTTQRRTLRSHCSQCG